MDDVAQSRIKKRCWEQTEQQLIACLHSLPLIHSTTTYKTTTDAKPWFKIGYVEKKT